MFLGSVSAGLVALGLMVTATEVGRAFYAFALILLPTLSFVGLMTFERALQSSIEDLGYARRTAELRGYYFDNAPGLDRYLYSVSPDQRLLIQGLRSGTLQGFRTVAGTVAVITSVLAGSSVGLLDPVLSRESLVVGFAVGGAVAAAALVAMIRYQRQVWTTVLATPFRGGDTGE